MEKMILITPHLSTGGAPQFTLNKIQLLKDEYELYCIEYSILSLSYVVQRNKIIEILKDNFFSLNNDKSYLLKIIKSIDPDIIYLEEIGETFIEKNILKEIYSEKRKYKIIETTHSSNDKSDIKKWLPDKFIFVTEYSKKMYSNLNVDSDVIEYPIVNKKRNKIESQNKLNLDNSYKHILNVGLFTPGKNQGYAFEIARKFENERVLFHFIGNQAENFKKYWKPIMKNKPKNCIIWGEKDNVNEFIKASDLFLFTSKFELNPLVIKEALCYDDIPIFMFNLETYMGKYDNTKNINFLSNNIENDTLKIKKKIK